MGGGETVIDDHRGGAIQRLARMIAAGASDAAAQLFSLLASHHEPFRLGN